MNEICFLYSVLQGNCQLVSPPAQALLNETGVCAVSPPRVPFCQKQQRMTITTSTRLTRFMAFSRYPGLRTARAHRPIRDQPCSMRIRPTLEIEDPARLYMLLWTIWHHGMLLELPQSFSHRRNYQNTPLFASPELLQKTFWNKRGKRQR